MSTRRKHTQRKAAAAAHRVHGRVPAGPSASEPALIGLARQVRAWTDSVLGIAGAATDLSLGAAKAILVKPGQRATVEKAGAALRRFREAAGLSVKEVGEAIDFDDPALLELVERGKAALPFEVILRLASVLGRNDPVSFVMRLTRSYNPDVWRTLESLGVGRLVVQAGREREFANVYRGSDAARALSDEEFAAALAFVRQAFELALAFATGERSRLRGAKRRPRRPLH